MLLTATKDSHVRRKLCLCVFLFTIEVYQISDKRKSNRINGARKLIAQLDMLYACKHVCYCGMTRYVLTLNDTRTLICGGSCGLQSLTISNGI